MKRIWISAALLLALLVLSSSNCAGWTLVFANAQPGLTIGAADGRLDGYDGESITSILPTYANSGAVMALYKWSGPGWTGQSGYYSNDIRSSLSPGETKTWSDIYLFCLNNEIPDHTNLEAVPWDVSRLPTGYDARLYIDHVPSTFGWTGPWNFAVYPGASFLLPVPTVSDPESALTNGTRMHLTVTAPVPEPCSVAALALGLVPLGLAGLRRKRKS